MNFLLSQIPDRSAKPRKKGVSMIMDKGMSLRETEDFLSVSADFTDIVKLGWGTSVITTRLKEKLTLYKEAGIPTYFGGTLFEIFYVRNQLDDYRRILDDYQMSYVEISNGSVDIPLDEKCQLISLFAQDRHVLSEVGSKSANKLLAPFLWVEMMQAELKAGSQMVIAEARESGTVGMFNADGGIRTDLLDEILHQIPSESILWEAPMKSQQAWFIKKLGCDVNLGNIAPQEALPLETLRLGLRSDTFFTFLDAKS